MSAGCHDHAPAARALGDPRYRQVLWIALAVNAGMFAVELLAGLQAASQALKADALDFLGDALTYGITLLALGWPARRRAQVALLKGIAMGVFGIWVAAEVIRHLIAGTLPGAVTMGGIGALALAANLAVAVMLYRWRQGDANMHSVWLCTRNDAIGNLAVIIAGAGVGLTGSGWPDLVVASLMAGLALWSSAQVIAAARGELAAAPA